MPEIPDLEAIRAFLNERIAGAEVVQAKTFIPHVLRTGAQNFEASLTGNRLGEVTRYGKFLMFALADDYVMVINPMLTGRFQYVDPKTKKAARTCFVLQLDTGYELRYADHRVMGKVYVVRVDEVLSLPVLNEAGPDALAVTEDEFRTRIRKHSGAIKNVLTNQKFVAGIGNAYSDEILFRARIDPFRKRTELSADEIGALYRAVREVNDWAIPILREHFREELDYREWREHLNVHRKGGEHVNKDEGRCPRCGTHISQISPNDRVTSWCRNCQR